MRDGDRYRVPHNNMSIRVNWSETGDTVGIWRRCRDRESRALFDELTFQTFEGRPSERRHVVPVVLGVVMTSIGVGLGVLVATG